ncbi:hypothetical protein [Nocardia tengchongensis]|uniref:hypothetical protein n=1 Tax=Nocardia tengchongensis TaxID=2055889 RepID=UPI003623F2FB
MVEPVLTVMAATGLYDLVRKKFAKSAEQTAVLEAAVCAGTDSPQVRQLAQALQHAELTDPAFGAQLRTE